MCLLLNVNIVFLNSLFTGPHMLFVLLLVILLFGGKKIPELARGLGQGIRQFNEAKDGIVGQIEKGNNHDANNFSNSSVKQ